MNTIKIILADDHTLVRAGLKALLSLSAEFEVIGEAGDGEEAIRLVEDLQPDLLVLDLSMPHMSGNEVFYEMRKIKPDVRVILASGYTSEHAQDQFPDLRPEGFVQKPFVIQVLLDSIQKALTKTV